MAASAWLRRPRTVACHATSRSAKRPSGSSDLAEFVCSPAASRMSVSVSRCPARAGA
jgi:hypothetical protein